ncbi:MFS transporter [Sinomonas cyclohexanicum]|uniref:MFS transporter n=1 Tax=Sinomonas cyclohexanicum TaxID=322009 RepID=A0ABM7PZM1_SINCY|nr:MFS transporter [Corynebacterium cyclohexanicum]BCT77754.1 MFS transporter [Corynebacterium cyclohexanicum]
MTTPSSALPATGPIALVPQRLPWRHTFISLTVPNFRMFTAAHFVAVVALWMQRIAQDWLVLELSGSVTAVGVTVALQFAPVLVLGPWGGLLADRFSKRRLLQICAAAAGACAAVLGTLALTGALAVWHVYTIAAVLGLVTVLDQPARQVFVNELVGPGFLRNAISLNSTVFQLGALIGPAVAGWLLTAVGGGWAFVVNAFACTTTAVMLSLLRKDQLEIAPPTPASRGMLREAVKYAWSKPTIRWPWVMAGVVALFAMSLPVLLAAYADTVFSVGAAGYGLLNTMVAVGAVTGAIASARRLRLRLRTVVIGAGLYGTMLAVAAFAPSMPVFCALVAVSGFCALTFLTSANQLVQTSANVGIRGRVMSLYTMVLIGGQALGGPMLGWLAEHVGAHWAMLISGAVPALAAASLALRLRKASAG